MKFSRSKTTATLIALLLMLIIAISLIALPAANAHTPKWTIQSYLNIHVAPNPVGVGQQVYIVMFTTWALPGASVGNDIRFHDFKLTITKPDEHTEVMNFPVVPDSGGSVFTLYTPDQIGTYTLLLEYPGQTYEWSGSYQNDTILGSSKTVTFTVQEEPIGKVPDTPLPTEYWTRPIDAQNFLWGEISSNWLSGAGVGVDRWQKDGSSPKTSHVMWTRTLELGGVVGGTDPLAIFYGGFSYEDRFGRRDGGGPIVISGILYYPLPLGNTGSRFNGYIAVDLRTGEEIWYRDDILPEKGQLLNFQQTPNQHGTVGGILWDTVGSTWLAYDALYGKNIFNLTGVPGGTEVYVTSDDAELNSGMIVRYVLNYPGRWLALWNSTEAVTSVNVVQSGPGWRATDTGTFDASNAYSWNVTIPDLPGASNPSIVGIIPGDLILGRSSSVQLSSNWRQTPDPYTMWAISDRPESRGQLLWIEDYPAPPNNLTRMVAHQPIDTVNRVFLMSDRETDKRYGYSLDTGQLMWSTDVPEREIQYYSARQGFPAYGNLYISGYGGEIFCYSTLNGTLLWKYNNTDSGTGTPWGLIPTHISAVADGVVYAFSGEHSPNKPLYHDYRVRAVDAFTGEELWTLKGWSASGLGTTLAPIAIADGYLAYLNLYDGQVYSVGRGPSATTVSIQNDVITHGDTVLIKGTVVDIAAGTKQNEIAARFPNGVPAISDENMTAWMEYLYMQQPRPTATGVSVTLSVFDPNNNLYDIGTVTSDANGMYSLLWEPPVPGEYIVTASFDGSEGYWPSFAEAALGVLEAPAATPEPTPPPASVADIYFLPMSIGMIIAIIVVGAVLVLMLRRR
jgi:outer membrane protein assembly factor BamB